MFSRLLVAAALVLGSSEVHADVSPDQKPSLETYQSDVESIYIDLKRAELTANGIELSEVYRRLEMLSKKADIISLGDVETLRIVDVKGGEHKLRDYATIKVRFKKK